MGSSRIGHYYCELGPLQGAGPDLSGPGVSSILIPNPPNATFPKKVVSVIYVKLNKRVFVYLTRNIDYMKKKLLFVAAFVLLALAFNSCSVLNNCKMCALVSYENGSVINTGTETQYCGTDLLTEEAKPDVTVGTITTKHECH